MKKVIIIITALLVLSVILVVGRKTFHQQQEEHQDTKTAEDTLPRLQSESEIMGKGKSLNDIRFADFKDKDWLDNDYIRCLRMYIDDYKKGKVKNGTLDKYKDKIQGHFVVWQVEPCLMGGLFIQFIFVDSPSELFQAWVYSDVDEDTEKITGYYVPDITIGEQNSGLTKEEILKQVKEHPELKLW